MASHNQTYPLAGEYYAAEQQLPFACIVDSSHDDSSFDAQTAMGIVYTSTDHLMPYHTMATLPYQSSDFVGHPELQFDLKSAPRLDTRIDSIALDYDAFSASTSSWSLSPLSGSIDGGHFYPINAQENPSPPLTKSENVFVSGLPCYNETGPDKAEVSVSNDDYLPVHATACLTISPESLESSSGQELPEQPDYLDDSKLRMETFVQPKRQVATPKVLAASRRRRGQIKQGIELLDCELCGETFTAKHNLINHRNSHYGKKPFSCDWCARSFGTKHVLKRHQKRCQIFLRHENKDYSLSRR
ncbi:hypothetical protein C8R42DRAFT_379624 [Lentinula raphanica]|nr:hypothetical protein C8R42DRAFT_379624 [Lentinula raphanica]